MVLSTYVRTQGGAQAHSIFFLPHSINYAYEASGSKKPFEVEQNWVDSLAKLNGNTLWLKPHFVPPSPTTAPGKAMTEPFWAARKDYAGGDITPSLVLSSLNIAGSHTTVAKDVGEKRGGAKTYQWFVPVLTNPEELKCGTELWWAGGIKKKRPVEPLKLSLDSAKKQKTVEKVE